MLFSIPETTQCSEESGSKFWVSVRGRSHFGKTVRDFLRFLRVLEISRIYRESFDSFRDF